MSSDFYFREWRKTLADLNTVVNMDVHFQETKINDKRLCEATERLSGILGQYMAVYNKVWECLQQNLQVQKTRYINDVLTAVVHRILELKQELRKLEASQVNFNSNGLVNHKLTPYDVELREIPKRFERPDSINTTLEEAFKRVEEKRKLLEEEAAKAELPEDEPICSWWDTDENVEESDTEVTKVVEMSIEQKQFKQMIETIQAQERSRQVLTRVRQARSKRIRWEKELLGTLPPPAPYAIREQGARLIQRVCRTYFELKRQKFLQTRRDEYLGLLTCFKPKLENMETFEQVTVNRIHTKRKYDEKLETEHEHLKKEFTKRKGDDIGEHYRDEIRDWFKTWYESIQYFHDIPNDKEGGAALIFREELPNPEEWLEEYKEYIANKDKKNTKFAKLEAKREAMERKREEHMKMKLEKELLKKMMKNPTMHPGYTYPMSSKTDTLVQVIIKYHRDWDDLDTTECINVKKKYVMDVAENDAYAEARKEILTTVEEDMKNELKLLRKALKIDYSNIGEEMLKPMKQTKNKKGKKIPKAKKDRNENISEKIENLISRGFVKKYPRMTIKEFMGDPNFGGDDMRCDVLLATPASGEVRNIWWERCREMVHGFHRILLVGPSGSGKTTLVNVLASINDAVLFELDASTLPDDLLVGVFLNHLVQTVATCAKYFQPSVIHIKHAHKLFYSKVPPEDTNINWKHISRYFIKKIFKNIQKSDKVTVIGTCTEPWMSSNALIKQFPTVQLMPYTSYGTLTSILRNWVVSHTVIPADFNFCNLAYVLRGYSYGYVKDALEKFLTAETIARIAARGLSPLDIYNFILQDNPDGKVDYEKYLTWYANKTTSGAKEKNHHEQQLQFKEACAIYAERSQKKKKLGSVPSTPLHGSRENLA